MSTQFLFQSTLPLRGATLVGVHTTLTPSISIHTPLAGSDDARTGARRPWTTYFNPHSPCGERRGYVQLANGFYLFQSTLPLRGATVRRRPDNGRAIISIHTPLAGSDPSACWNPPTTSNFNPHSPCGERLSRSAAVWRSRNFNPHSPCGERLQSGVTISNVAVISIHTPLAGSDANLCHKPCRIFCISIHTPLAGSDCPILPPIHGIVISIHTPLAGSDFSPFTRNSYEGKFQSTLPLRGATAEMRHF